VPLLAGVDCALLEKQVQRDWHQVIVQVRVLPLLRRQPEGRLRQAILIAQAGLPNARPRRLELPTEQLYAEGLSSDILSEATVMGLVVLDRGLRSENLVVYFLKQLQLFLILL